MSDIQDPVQVFEELISTAIQPGKLVAVDVGDFFIPLAKVVGLHQVDGEDVFEVEPIVLLDGDILPEGLIVAESHLEQPDEVVLLDYVILSLHEMVEDGELDKEVERLIKDLLFSVGFHSSQVTEEAEP